jgi:hypothetical protein
VKIYLVDQEKNVLHCHLRNYWNVHFPYEWNEKKSWVKEIHDIRADYEQKLKIMQRKAYKTEQVLSLQSYKAQQELKSRQQELNFCIFLPQHGL